MRTLHGIVSVLLLAFVLTACTTVAPTSAPTQDTWQTRKAQLERIQSWQLNGKVAVQTSNIRDSQNASRLRDIPFVNNQFASQ